MDKVKKVYVDSRFRTADSASNSDFRYELKEALDLPDNTVCYVDDITIPHTWRTIDSHNNKLYMIFKTFYLSGGGESQTVEYTYDGYVLIIPEGNYSGATLAAEIQNQLNNFAVNFDFVVTYNIARGTISIQATIDEGFASTNAFIVPNDFQVVTWQAEGTNYQWKNREGVVQAIDINSLQSINNAVLRVSSDTEIDYTHITAQSEFYRTFESGFLDLLSVHNIYIHCPNLGHFNSVGCRGENSIIKKVPVSSSFGYLILDSVVAPHDKMDVSRQTVKTIEISLRDVYGTVINLHGASVSFSLIFVSVE
jgi:hypothetical protein